MRTPAIILAAGASTRMGSPKQLALLGGEPMLLRAIRVVQQAGGTPLVVLGAHAEEIRRACDLGSVKTVLNSDWEQGMSSSIRTGVENVDSQAEALILMLCDQPAVTAEHLKALLETCQRLARPVASAYHGRKGVPACFPRACFPELTRLSGDAGARTLLADAEAVPLPLGELDVDTPERLAEAERLF